MTIKPSKKQLGFLDWEFGIFFHFGIRTFYEGRTDWDGIPMDAAAFDPKKLDCRQWIRTAKNAGARYAVFTAKHHDGFANWDSAYTEYSVKNTPLKERDIVREFTEACREYGLGIGIYYSPAQFGSRTAENYDDYFIGQISELLTNYGKIDYLWFDGCGSEGHEYDKERIIKAIRSMQPEILIFNMWDPDTRWIGNEDGIAPENNCNIVKSLSFSVLTDEKDGLDEYRFLPAECDCRIRENWFYQDADKNTLKSLDELKNIYECSVGRGANLLLNLGPDRNGLIQDDEAERTAELGKWIESEFGSPKAVFENSIPDFNDEFSYMILSEDMTDGQHVYSFSILADGNEIYSGSTIGHKKICRFERIFANEITIETNAAARIACMAF